MPHLALKNIDPVPEAPHAFEWCVASSPVPYPAALQLMEKRVEDIAAGHAPELFWLLEHPPLYTAGTSAGAGELLKAKFPVFETGRGGRFTYHGPGQRVIYVMSDLRTRGRDVRAHVGRLEDWVIRVLKEFGIEGERREGRVGIWVVRAGETGRVPLPLREGSGEGFSPEEQKLDVLRETPHQQKLRLAKEGKPKFLQPLPQGERSALLNAGPREEKIAAIGVRVRRWITYHGLSLNVNPDLSHYKGIVPCGLPQFGVTSLHALGVKATMEDVDRAFRKHAADVFES